ncbi:MAG: class I SAM-dependent methyltransferase, partial [Chthoniobacterales bacterium]
ELLDLRVLGCLDCGLVQLERIPAIETLRPHFDWLRYNEPEAHLDEVADAVARLAPTERPVVGLTYKDNTFLARVQNLGFENVRQDIAGQVFAGSSSPWGVETVADWLASGSAEGTTSDAGLVVARHVIEHCQNPSNAVRAMLSWLGSDGLLFVEVPGCREALERGIPELLWEEHASYFTESTLKQLLTSSGAEVVHFSEHAYPFESSLVAIVRPAAGAKAVAARGDVGLAEQFGRQVKERVNVTAQGLQRRESAKQRTVIFGAGHLSCAFLSLSQSAECIECVLDDTPQKSGLYLAGTQLPIVATSDLPAGAPGLCLMAVHPSSEQKVYDRLAPLRAAGWQVASIFPDSKYGVRWN